MRGAKPHVSTRRGLNGPWCVWWVGHQVIEDGVMEIPACTSFQGVG